MYFMSPMTDFWLLFFIRLFYKIDFLYVYQSFLVAPTYISICEDLLIALFLMCEGRFS